MIILMRIPKSDPGLLEAASRHYSQPGGFPFRSLCYRVEATGRIYGYVVGGNSTLHLPGRDEFFGIQYLTGAARTAALKQIVNNVFFHIEPGLGYPERNFAQKTIATWRAAVSLHWPLQYGDEVMGFETLVQIHRDDGPPRTGELYLRDGWQRVGLTEGTEACRRVGAEEYRQMTGREMTPEERRRGKRVWTVCDEPRPKLVLCRRNIPGDFNG